MPLVFLGWAALAFGFDETTNTKIEDKDFAGGYTQSEIDSLKAEQKKIMKKFMEGRYSSAVDSKRRYSGIAEYHDNLDGITPHDKALNAAEKSGDVVGLGKAGLNGNERLRAKVIERINSSGNCELTKEDQEQIKKNNFTAVKGAVKGQVWNTQRLLKEVVSANWNTYLEFNSSTKTVRIKSNILSPPSTNLDKARDMLRTYTKAIGGKYFPETDAAGQPTGNYRMRCPNVSAIVLDAGAAHAADLGAEHRIYVLNKKTWTPGTGSDGPFGATAQGETTGVAKQYVDRVKQDSARTAIPPEIVAAMKARGMDVWTEQDGAVVVTRLPDGSLMRDEVQASPDDFKSEYAWLESQNKHRLLTTEAVLKAEMYLQGRDNYDPSQVPEEMMSLYATHAKLPEAERNKKAAEKIAEHNIYSGTEVCLRVLPNGNSTKLSAPGPCPPGFASADLTALQNDSGISGVCSTPPGPPCYVSGNSMVLRDPSISGRVQGVDANTLTQMALDAAKKAVAADPTRAAEFAKNKDRLATRLKDCMGPGKWCEQVDLSGFPTNRAELNTKLANDPKLKGRGITTEDVKAGMVYLDVGRDVGNAFADTRAFNASKMASAMDGPLATFEQNAKSLDFSKSTNPDAYNAMLKQQQINMQMVRDIRAASDKAYQDCVSAGANDCVRQYDDNNFNPNTMSSLKLFGRDPGRDGKTFNNEETALGGELTQAEVGPGGTQPIDKARKPSSALPPRGSSPSAPASPFSLN